MSKPRAKLVSFKLAELHIRKSDLCEHVEKEPKFSWSEPDAARALPAKMVTVITSPPSSMSLTSRNHS